MSDNMEKRGRKMLDADDPREVMPRESNRRRHEESEVQSITPNTKEIPRQLTELEDKAYALETQCQDLAELLAPIMTQYPRPEEDVPKDEQIIDTEIGSRINRVSKALAEYTNFLRDLRDRIQL